MFMTRFRLGGLYMFCFFPREVHGDKAVSEEWNCLTAQSSAYFFCPSGFKLFCISYFCVY